MYQPSSVDPLKSSLRVSVPGMTFRAALPMLTGPSGDWPYGRANEGSWPPRLPILATVAIFNTTSLDTLLFIQETTTFILSCNSPPCLPCVHLLQEVEGWLLCSVTRGDVSLGKEMGFLWALGKAVLTRKGWLPLMDLWFLQQASFLLSLGH